MTKTVCGLVRDAGLSGRARLAAADPDWDAVGPPAGCAVQPAVLVDQYAVHAASYLFDDRHRMPERFEDRLQAGHVGKPILQLELRAFGPDARRLDRFLQRHSVVDYVQECLRD